MMGEVIGWWLSGRWQTSVRARLADRPHVLRASGSRCPGSGAASPSAEQYALPSQGRASLSPCSTPRQLHLPQGRIQPLPQLSRAPGDVRPVTSWPWAPASSRWAQAAGLPGRGPAQATRCGAAFSLLWPWAGPSATASSPVLCAYARCGRILLSFPLRAFTLLWPDFSGNSSLVSGKHSQRAPSAPGGLGPAAPPGQPHVSRAPWEDLSDEPCLRLRAQGAAAVAPRVCQWSATGRHAIC